MRSITRAAVFANFAHRDQKRKYNGTPYIWHPMRVAGRLTLLGAPDEEIAAAWLHDTLEDCPSVSKSDLIAVFGHRITALVTQLTNPPKPPGLDRSARKAVDRARLKCIEPAAIQIKLLDRIDNLRELMGCPDPAFIELYRQESILLGEALAGHYPALDRELYELAAPGHPCELYQDMTGTCMVCRRPVRRGGDDGTGEG